MPTISEITNTDPTHIVYIETDADTIRKYWDEQDCDDMQAEDLDAFSAVLIRVYPDHDEVWFTFDADWLGEDTIWIPASHWRNHEPDPAQIPMFEEPPQFYSMTVGQMMDQLQELLDKGKVDRDTEVLAHGPTISTYWGIDRELKFKKKDNAVLLGIG